MYLYNFFALLVANILFIKCSSKKTIEIRMPHVSPKKNESYFCAYKRLPRGVSYAVEFKALADESTAHHILVIGCRKPRHFKKHWSCENSEVCQDEEKVIYAWAKNAPALQLPNNVGFELGYAETKYLVIQVHYARPLADGEADTSGVSIILSRRQPKYAAGIYLFEQGDFEIPPKSKAYHVDMSCLYRSHSIAPFAFRTHTHKTGKVVSAYRIRKKKWHLIGKGNPQEPQAFFPIHDRKKSIIHKGDHLVARCTYDSSNASGIVYSGSFSEDEMCNFYMMYYTKPDYIDDIAEGCDQRKHHLKFPKSADNVITNFPPTTKVSFRSTQKVEITTNSPAKLLVQSVFSNLSTKSKEQPYPVFDDNWFVGENSLGQISGVAIKDKNTVVLFHRGDHVWDSSSFDDDDVYVGSDKAIETETILEIDVNTGNVKNRLGGKIRLQWSGIPQPLVNPLFYLPHGLTIDHKGNYWLTDVALHQVFKFSGKNFELLFKLGERFKPGLGNYQYCKPTDVAVEKSGNFFVADGYCNSRIIKYDAAGTLIQQWGIANQDYSNPGPGEFYIPHSLSLDHERHQLYIADRENGRIQVYTTNGEFLRIIKHASFGRQLFAVSFNSAYGGVLYAVNGMVEDKTSGFTLKASTGAIINHWTATTVFKSLHDVTVSPDNKDVYVAQIGPNMLRKFKIQIPQYENFPWKPVDKEKGFSTSAAPTEAASDNVVNIPPIDYDNENTIVPALIVVLVLAFPLVLILIGVIIQHINFSNKRHNAIQKMRLNPLNSRDKKIFFGCCVTTEYSYESDRAFDQLIKGEIVVDEEEDELFSRKA